MYLNTVFRDRDLKNLLYEGESEVDLSFSLLGWENVFDFLGRRSPDFYLSYSST